MSGDQWARAIPLAGICLVLLVFAAAMWVRASRTGVRSWPLPWDYLSALFLCSLGLTAGWGVARLVLRYPDHTENRAVTLVLWGTLAICLWTLKRWWKGDAE